MATTYELRPPRPVTTAPPRLDEHQQAVVDHREGPLLVLAGPGTGKTTTLVETVAHRVEACDLRPEQVLVLTFSRKAAGELRTRISRRLGRTTAAPMATTFHSFCYAVVRRFQNPASFERPLQLLSAAEQDSRIQELLAGTQETQTVDWPANLRPALRTRGLATELQAMMARVRSLGMDPQELLGIARQEQRADWRSAAQFFGEYLDVFDAQNLIDYAELVHRALVVAADPTHQRQLREEFRLVVVDEYQDTDPSQVGVLQALCGGGRDLIAVGDPDQSIYAFRGADVRGLLDFPAQFPTVHGRPAPTVALRNTRRFGPAILAASRAVIARAGVTGHLDPDTFAAFRRPRSVDPPYGEGDVRVQTYASPAAEAENIALQLRRAHLSDGLPWSQMAVLVRSGTASIPRLQRALVAAGVPVEVAGDELPLRASPAVAALVATLGLVEGLARDGTLPPDGARAVLTGPIGAIDQSSLRLLARALRRLDARIDPETNHATRLARPSDELLAEALAEPALLAQVEQGRTAGVAGRVGRLARLLADARRQVGDHAAPEQIMWTLWHDSGWESRLRAAVRAGGDAARSADRDLDAVCALFDLAARAEERQQRRGLSSFVAEIESQQIPADTLAERGVRGEAVRLLTAHRAKGLEWRLVVVAGVQEGVWPDTRRRGTLFQTDRLGPAGQQPPPSTAAALAEERRLFYVAVTRARQRLVVTAVQSPTDDGDQPSRFLVELREHVTAQGGQSPARLGRPERPLSLRGAVAELREIAENTANAELRRAAVQRLARLAASGDAGGVAGADPTRWWGVREPTVNARPVRPPDRRLELSGSSLNAIVTCPLSWFLAHEAKGETASTSAQGFGLLIHALAADVVRGSSSDEPDALVAHLDEVWQELAFVAPWVSDRERVEAEQAIGRFVAWHRGSGRTPVAAEHRFEVTVPIGGEEVVLRGSMDRVEVDADGLVHVVDFKTGRTKVSAEQLRNHAQLGVYQLAVEHGGVDQVVPDAPARSGGAELVQLRIDDSAKTPGVPKVQPQDPPAPGQTFVALDQLARATRIMREEDFVATPSEEACGYCDFRALCPARPEGRTILPTPDADADTDADADYDADYDGGAGAGTGTGADETRVRRERR